MAEESAVFDIAAFCMFLLRLGHGDLKTLIQAVLMFVLLM